MEYGVTEIKDGRTRLGGVASELTDYCWAGAGLHPWPHFTQIHDGGSQERTLTVMTSTAPQLGPRGVSGDEGGIGGLGIDEADVSTLLEPKVSQPVSSDTSGRAHGRCDRVPLRGYMTAFPRRSRPDR